MSKNKLWVLTFGNASSDDDENANAFCGCVGIFNSELEAKRQMTAFKDDFIFGLTDELEDEDDIAEIKNSIKVYGSEKEEFYEVDYTVDDITAECYIRIEEKEIF